MGQELSSSSIVTDLGNYKLSNTIPDASYNEIVNYAKSKDNLIADLSNNNNVFNTGLDKLYKNVDDTNDKIIKGFTHQNEMIDIVENEKERLLLKKGSIDSALTNKNREMILNDNVRKKYARYTDLMIVIIMTIICFLIILLLSNTFPIIPEPIITILTIIVVSVGIINGIYILYDIVIRDPLYFDRLNVPPPVAKLTPQQLAVQSQSGDLLSSMTQVCNGQECCDDQVGTIWDPSSSTCIIDISNISQYDPSNNLGSIISRFTEQQKQGFTTLSASSNHGFLINNPYEFTEYSVYIV